MSIRIRNDFKALIPPLSEDEYRQLEQNILKDGIRDPLVVWDDILVDGHNRYEIAQKHHLSYECVHKNFADENEAIRWIILNQFGRRNLSAYDRSILALKLKPVIAAEAKKQQVRKPAEFVSQISVEQKPIDTQKELAKVAGVSHDTIAKVEKIERDAPAELKQAVKSGEKSINQAYQEIKREEKAAVRESKREQNAEKIEKLSSPLDAQGLFQTIVIDPPWDWGDEGDGNQFGRAKPDYHTMPIDEIEQLPIQKIADENCHLYLWVTNRSLPKAFRLIEAWGFRYITCLTWVKPSIGMGNYFRGSTEQVLFAVKGSQMLKRRDVGTHFEAPRGEKHSAKPDKFYSLVESCSYGPYIDIFGRDSREGWSVWGENS